MISTSERNVRARAIAEAALTYPTEKRAAFLARTCSEDAELGALVLGHLRARNGIEEDAMPADVTPIPRRWTPVADTASERCAPQALAREDHRGDWSRTVVLAHWSGTVVSDGARTRRRAGVGGAARTRRPIGCRTWSSDRWIGLEETQPAAADSVLRSLLDLRLETLGHGHPVRAPGASRPRTESPRARVRSPVRNRFVASRSSDAEDRYGPYHPEVADDLVDLGRLSCFDERKFDEAPFSPRPAP